MTIYRLTQVVVTAQRECGCNFCRKKIKPKTTHALFWDRWGKSYWRVCPNCLLRLSVHISRRNLRREIREARKRAAP